MVWLKDDSGHCVVFTRGEYLSQIFHNINPLTEETPLVYPFVVEERGGRMNWGKEDDAFDPKEVEKARKEREKNESERRPDGSPGYKCRCCGRINGATAIRGSCCYYCHATL